LPLLSDCKDSDINDVYQRDIARMERIVMSKSGIFPFIEDGVTDEGAGFYFFEIYTNTRWRPRRRD